MSKQVLQMKYHPAKKEVEFKRFQSGNELEIKKSSKLMEYMNKKGKFVLQNYGHKFFDDIAKAFDGEKYIDIKVITTKIDYDDFCQMVEEYNEQSTCKFNPTLDSELPDMNQTCSEVKKYGEEAISILISHRNELSDKIPFEILSKNDQIKKNLSKFDEEIVTQIENIRSKINSLNDSRVNLCFTGVYSSGKSSLINALLGYRVLPENITSETAKMITIYSPQLGENVNIKFKIIDVPSKIEWDENEYCFRFIEGPSEDNIRRDIQNHLNILKDKQFKQHEQINSILSKLNSMNEISSGIELIFPISLDNENVQFKIFDTPGTDSNNESHNYGLKNALEEQTHSILIFVAKPDGVEGTGNNILLDHLKEVEQNSSKTSIDIGRSLFIFNKADTLQASKRKKLQDQELTHKGDGNFSVKLNDKKLFFISALYAYVAKAKKNGILSDDEIALYGCANVMMNNDFMGNCYKQNRSGESELGTNQLIEKCDKALQDAKQKGNDTDIIIISSGLYALESEIIQYAEKFSPSVRAFAIINSLDKAIQKLTDEAESSIKRNQDEIERINSDIKNLKEIVSNNISDKAEEMKIKRSEDKSLDSEVMTKISERLGVDHKRFTKDVIDKVKDSLNKKLLIWYFDFNIKDKESDKVQEVIHDTIDKFMKEAKDRRNKLLEDKQREFIEEVKKIISENGDISENTKNDLLEIPSPIKVEINTEWDKLYKSHTKTTDLFIFKTTSLNKEQLFKQVEQQLLEYNENFINGFLNDYNNALDDLINEITENYKEMFEHYSNHLKEMNAIIENLIELGKAIKNAANDLKDCKRKMNAIIWGANNNV